MRSPLSIPIEVEIKLKCWYCQPNVDTFETIIIITSMYAWDLNSQSQLRLWSNQNVDTRNQIVMLLTKWWYSQPNVNSFGRIIIIASRQGGLDSPYQLKLWSNQNVDTLNQMLILLTIIIITSM